MIHFPATIWNTVNGVSIPYIDGSGSGSEAKEPEPVEGPKVYPACDFCNGPTVGSSYDQESQGKRWAICSAPRCWQAAGFQKDRIYNGLFDSMQTRRDVLSYTDRKNGKLK